MPDERSKFKDLGSLDDVVSEHRDLIQKRIDELEDELSDLEGQRDRADEFLGDAGGDDSDDDSDDEKKQAKQPSMPPAPSSGKRQ